MLESITPQSINQGGLEGQGFLSGLDLMASIQILLIQDYDEQLRHLAQGMKAFKNVKQAYRKDIQPLQQALLGRTIKIDGKEYVEIKDQSVETAINRKVEYVPNLETGSFEEHKKTADKLVDFKNWKDNDDFGQKEGGGRLVEKDQLQKKIELINMSLDSFNEQSELSSLQLQTLTNQRKVAFEALSNLISKESETLGSIVRNMRS